MKQVSISKRLEKVIDEPIKHNIEQFGLFLLNSSIYRLLWLDGYLFCFDDGGSWFFDADGREIIPVLFISNCHFLKIGYKKFCLLDQSNGNLKFKDEIIPESDVVIFPIVKIGNHLGRLAVDAIKKYEGKNAKQGA